MHVAEAPAWLAFKQGDAAKQYETESLKLPRRKKKKRVLCLMQRLAEPRSLAEKHPSLTLRLDREKSRFPLGVSRLDNPHSSLCSLVSKASCLFLCSLFLTFQHFASLFEGRHTEKERYKTYKRKRKIVLVWRPICSNTQRRRSFSARALAPIAFSPQLHKQAHSFQTQRTVTMVLGTFFFFFAPKGRASPSTSTPSVFAEMLARRKSCIPM